MSRLRSLCLALLAGSIVLLTGSPIRAVDKDELKVGKEIVDKLLGGAEVKTVADLKKKTSVDAIMTILGSPKAGGVGYGPKADISIEKRLQDLAKKGISAADLAKESGELTKAVQFARAVTEYNELYTPEKKVAGKDPKVWTKSSEDTRKASADLLEALKGKDEKKVHAAAKSLDAACNACHTVFK